MLLRSVWSVLLVGLTGCSVAPSGGGFASEGDSQPGSSTAETASGGLGETETSVATSASSEGDGTTLSPGSTSQSDTTGDSGPPETCGNAELDMFESCDGAEFGEQTCSNFADADGEAFTNGVLACDTACQIDTSGCSRCGDEVTNAGEECDGDADDVECTDLGLESGTVACSEECTYDISGCAGCGNGMVGENELCDCGDELCTFPQLGSLCTELLAPMNGNYTGGALACAPGCRAYDESGCVYCGDGARNGNEPCDGDDLGAASCVDAGWLPGGGGEVSCAAGCELDATACTGETCGGSLAAPPDGELACPAPWAEAEGEGGCGLVCSNLGPDACDDPIECPPGRDCGLDCGFLGCNSKTINCAPGHACDIECTQNSACTGNSTIVCPPDAPCSVTCSQLACADLTVVCPAGNYACDVTCEAGSSSCPRIDVQCGDGPCALSCGGGVADCTNAELNCGPNACTATCEGTSSPAVDCADSCDCTECP